MYYQNYEDYMRQVLGYPINDPNIYEQYDYRNNNTYYLNQTQRDMTEEATACYPEIYHKIYPIVCKVCDSYSKPITRELIEQMTDEVYNSIEGNDNRMEQVNKVKNDISKTTRKDFNRKDEISEKRETRQTNFLLRDLIKILILNKILERPPRPIPMPRPPFSGGPGGRPPFQNF